METAAVIDQVVRSGRDLRVEDGALLEAHQDTGPVRAFPRPSNRPRREVDSLDRASHAGQIGSVPAVSAAEFEHTPRDEEAAAEPLGQILVGPFDEERDRFGPVGEELVPPAAVRALQGSDGRAWRPVAGAAELVWH